LNVATPEVIMNTTLDTMCPKAKVNKLLSSQVHVILQLNHVFIYKQVRQEKIVTRTHVK
jgi:hypothetical protein